MGGTRKGVGAYLSLRGGRWGGDGRSFEAGRLFFCLQDGRLFEVGANLRLGAYYAE